jgi:Na+/phosphate symporter
VRMVRTGVLRAWGDRLKHFIEVRLGNRYSAFFRGHGILPYWAAARRQP